ncbi:MAG TPA: tetratricopeptide repeat protein [Tepidisphaeraceae bacterium]|nr:tetratricopeptide repeat protein [Tepidisphaeraceae bacterium]
MDFARESVPQRWVDELVPEDLPRLKYPEYFNDLDKARLQVQSGRYRLALVTLAGTKDADPVEAGLLKASALSALGRTQQAMEVLTQPKLADEPRAQVLLGGIHASQGKTDEALPLLKKHVAAHPDSLAGRYQLGRLHEQVGDAEAAKQTYAWFIQDAQLLEKWRGQTGEAVFDDAGSVTIIGRAIDRWANLTGAFKDDAQLHNLLLNMFVKAYDVIDRNHQPARVAAAEYYLAHDNRAEAVKELEQAIEANPNDLAALRLLGAIALDSFNFDGADQVIADIRKVDRASPVADLLEGRNLLQQRRPFDAIEPIERVLGKQPRNLEALGLLAGAYSLQLEDQKAADVLKRVESIDPDNASAYYEVAEQLSSMRQYPRAAHHYKIAIERAPTWTAPRNGLGLLYTQSGDEDDARATLDAAHSLDPFNLATTNYLRLLDDLAKFAKSETDHFIVYYDAQSDPLIPEYFGEYLESIHKDVTAKFRTEPEVKTLIEVFPTHDAFSVRTTGSPWIGTVGASTGRVIALVSPRKGKMTMGTFNWANVLRHEYVHTVTLAATENRIAHWMTEGLAVVEEQSPIPWNWVPMLYNAVQNDKLFSLRNLTWGFVRPKRPSDRSLAYAQSYWICTYIEQKYGHDKILAMLDGFKNGRSEEDVFANVLGVPQDKFTAEFFAWTREQIKTWGYDKETTKKVDKLKEDGEELLAAGQHEKALPIWEEVRKLRPMDQLPHMRLASVYLKLKRTDDAVKHLQALHAVELKDNRYAKAIARIYRDTGRLDDAVKFAQQSVYIDPYDDAAHELLAGLYEKTGNETGLSREKRVISVLSEWRELQRAAEQTPGADKPAAEKPAEVKPAEE